jgi:hypothetical protein
MRFLQYIELSHLSCYHGDIERTCGREEQDKLSDVAKLMRPVPEHLNNVKHLSLLVNI